MRSLASLGMTPRVRDQKVSGEDLTSQILTANLLTKNELSFRAKRGISFTHFLSLT